MSSQRLLATSYLWLFSANIDTEAVDTQGTPLPQSLAALLSDIEQAARREAMQKLGRSGEFSLSEDTGEYDLGQLEKLLASGENG